MRAHVGLAFGIDSSIDPAEFVRRASLSAHRAAEVGDTRAVWSGDTGNLTADDLALLADLRLADQRDELSLAYQPQLSTKRAGSREWKRCCVGTAPAWLGLSRPLHRAGRADRSDRAADLVGRRRGARRPGPLAVGRHRLSRLGQPVAQHARFPARGRCRSRRVRREPAARVLTVEVTETDATDLMRAIDQLRPLHEHGVRSPSTTSERATPRSPPCRICPSTRSRST